MRRTPFAAVILASCAAFAATGCSKPGRTADDAGNAPPEGEAEFRNEGDASAVRAKALAGKSVLYALDRLRGDVGDAPQGHVFTEEYTGTLGP